MFEMRALVVLASTFAFAPLLCQELESGNWSDAEITARVRAALNDDETEALIDQETPKERNISVETNGGVVRLSGSVASEDDKGSAQQAAASVKGVADVRNELIVRQSDRAVGAVVEDSVIAARVKAQLADDAALGTAANVNVEVSAGIVQLSGSVDSAEEKVRAATIASNVSGVEDVRNDIQVQRR